MIKFITIAGCCEIFGDFLCEMPPKRVRSVAEKAKQAEAAHERRRRKSQDPEWRRKKNQRVLVSMKFIY